MGASRVAANHTSQTGDWFAGDKTTMRIRLTGIIASALMLVAQAGPASAISPNAGAVEGKGTVKDGDGRPGTW